MSEFSDARLFEWRSRGRTVFSGDGVVAALNGLVTNDVARVGVGEACFAAALSPKGKLLADLYLIRRASDFVADVSAGARDAWTAMIRKYVNPRFTRWRDASEELAHFTVTGASADEVLHGPLGAFAAPGPFQHSSVVVDGEQVTVGRWTMGGMAGLDVLASSTVARAMMDACRQAGARDGGPLEWDALRIPLGWPEFGHDMDENTLPQEARLDALGAISFSKGCYTGQETVARIHFRGHVNRTLRGLAGTGLLAPGSIVRDASGADVGIVRSAVLTGSGTSMALAMLRREVDAGVVTVGDGTAAVEARVVPLPMM